MWHQADLRSLRVRVTNPRASRQGICLSAASGAAGVAPATSDKSRYKPERGF